MRDYCLCIWDNDSVFVTDKGLVGLGPHIAKAGDVVAVMAGIPVPYILRPCVGDDFTHTVYQLVGDVYISGLSKVCKGVERTVIVLCQGKMFLMLMREDGDRSGQRCPQSTHRIKGEVSEQS